jgi:hypothetical protein
MSDAITLSSVTLDSPDVGKLAEFYAEITGGAITFRNDAWATVRCPGGRIDFQPNAEHCLVHADPAGHPFCLSTWDDVPT